MAYLSDAVVALDGRARETQEAAGGEKEGEAEKGKEGLRHGVFGGPIVGAEESNVRANCATSVGRRLHILSLIHI